jgi:hypothetical protein
LRLMLFMVVSPIKDLIKDLIEDLIKDPIEALIEDPIITQEEILLFSFLFLCLFTALLVDANLSMIL